MPSQDQVPAGSPAGTAADGTYLRGRMCDILDFAVRHIPRLHSYEKHWTGKQDPVVSMNDKIVVEAALLALTCHRVSHAEPRIAAAVRALAEVLLPHARSDRNADMLARLPQSAASIGTSHLLLDRIGYPDARYDALHTAAVAATHPCLPERLPYRYMEQQWLASLAPGGRASHGVEAPPGSVLYANQTVVDMHPNDVYSLTHAVMFGTDFGRRTVDPRVSTEAVLATLDSCLALQLGNENLDLIGELLFSAAMLRPGTTCAYTRAGWDLLTGVWERFGYLPSPQFSTPEYGELAPRARAAYSFQHTYHTMFVAGILCAVLYDALDTPPRPHAHAAPDDVASDAALALAAREYQLDVLTRQLGQLTAAGGPLTPTAEAAARYLQLQRAAPRGVPSRPHPQTRQHPG
ncbi:hypothetical protein OEIGOIKO_00254 [Streptomyces chrestomyceticus JCM 4735]|uniref:DUF6895 domain-containing protein n=1 Tax=Streptomyces chrestomyceticus JCM 4735 TaxID=1306181 RepID=A0A7U9KNL9_9ACTN|nr:hypothetical protein [Streptomyces chrestomyceticus]GCD32539.1 hypothetical protein OEIGOIKO_00254 [Streptomyces chrestomyceticus JCM 4735]